MCAILDANAAGEVFGHDRPEAGAEFFNWINKGRGRLVSGGKLLHELDRTPAREWMRQAMLAGLMRKVDDSEMDTKTAELRNSCRSDDPHVIALAQTSGARLLYSNDRNLHQDFTNKKLIDKPRGKVYSTLEDRSFQGHHSSLLQRKDLCRSGQ